MDSVPAERAARRVTDCLPCVVLALQPMQLTVPQRTVADTGSFPVNPEGVAQWLAELRPLDSEADAREVYRGLKHSNRLHNDVDRRRSVISCFVPVLRELQRHLSEQSNAQPLPLTREFARSAELRDSLLREEAFAFKILLADSKRPVADDARRAMLALARQAESVVHAYRTFPDALFTDAHQLYALAEQHDLLSVNQDTELLSLQDHYRYILLLATAELSQQRTRQLPMVMEFLKNCAADINITRQRSAKSTGKTDYAVDLQQGSRPEPSACLLSSGKDDVRWFNIAPVLCKVHEQSPHSKVRSANVLGSDILERQSLARLHVALARTRKRRLARLITQTPQCAVFRHKDICAHLLYRSAQDSSDTDSGWIVTNQSAHGACLVNETCRAGLVQVGELVSLTDLQPATPEQSTGAMSSKVDATLGVVRWVRANGKQSITIGIEFLSRTVLPVQVSKAVRDADEPDDMATNDMDIGEPALIIACKVQNSVLQTMLLPSFVYHVDDKLIAKQGARSRNVRLRECLQSNGLFSQFSLGEG